MIWYDMIWYILGSWGLFGWNQVEYGEYALSLQYTLFGVHLTPFLSGFGFDPQPDCSQTNMKVNDWNRRNVYLAEYFPHTSKGDGWSVINVHLIWGSQALRFDSYILFLAYSHFVGTPKFDPNQLCHISPKIPHIAASSSHFQRKLTSFSWYWGWY